MAYIAVASTKNFPSGTIQHVKAGSVDLIVVNNGGVFYGLQRKCPHLGADLSLGRIESGCIVCPKHSAAFDLATGAPAAKARIAFLRFTPHGAKIYKLRVCDEMIEVDLAESR